jgi:sRNA-binding regulator protein Hfq
VIIGHEVCMTCTAKGNKVEVLLVFQVFFVCNDVILGFQLTGSITKTSSFNVLIEFKTKKMNYRSVFLATTILIGEKSSTSCLIARHLDEKSRDCKQRIVVSLAIRNYLIIYIYTLDQLQTVLLRG